MTQVLAYIRQHWLILLVAAGFLGFFLYLTYEGNQFCDCAKTEKYRDGTSRIRSSGSTYYRYYHK